MSKIAPNMNDGIKWLSETIGNLPRVRSLVKIGRDNGLFTKSAQGKPAPALLFQDYIMLIVCALFQGGPTKLPEFINDMDSLRLFEIKYDNNDGNIHSADVSSLPNFHADWMKDFHIGTGEQSEFFFSGLWDLIFNRHFRWEFVAWDEVSLVSCGKSFNAKITLHEKHHPHNEAGYRVAGKGNRKIELLYNNGMDSLGGMAKVNVSIDAIALKKLADIHDFQFGGECT